MTVPLSLTWVLVGVQPRLAAGSGLGALWPPSGASSRVSGVCRGRGRGRVRRATTHRAQAAAESPRVCASPGRACSPPVLLARCRCSADTWGVKTRVAGEKPQQALRATRDPLGQGSSSCCHSHGRHCPSTPGPGLCCLSWCRATPFSSRGPSTPITGLPTPLHVGGDERVAPARGTVAASTRGTQGRPWSHPRHPVSSPIPTEVMPLGDGR